MFSYIIVIRYVVIYPCNYINKKLKGQNYLNSIDNNKKNSRYIIKTIDGHGGNEVYILQDFIKDNDKDNDKDIKTDMVIQPLLDKCNKDVRVYVLNNKIIAAVERCGNNDFRSNFSLGGSVKEYSLKENEINIVKRIINLFNEKTKGYSVKGLFYAGIDFLIDSNGDVLFNEIEDVVGSRMLYKATDIDIVDLYIKEIYTECMK